MRGITSRLRAALRARLAFDTRANMVFACVAACLLCGLWALLRGQDSNWDLRNYHLYNGYAALHGRLGLDLAPAQLQSYFHPVLDVVHYALMTGLPAILAGFLLGAWHGLVFALVAAIAWRVLADDPRRATRVPLLALAGLFTAAFFSELGNSMADNSTAVPVLAALLLVLSAQARARAGQGARWQWLLAGVLLGLAVALKLTNALYAVALGLAALAAGGRPRDRVAGAAWMTLAALLVFAAVGGPWFVRVWQVFGNPLFPQFNAWFRAPLALPQSVADTRWLPKNWGEGLVWPVLFSLRPQRVGDLALPQFGWAALYLLAVLGAAWRLLRRDPAERSAATPAARVLLVFFLVAYVLWQLIFSVHRYLVAIEVLLPLLLWWAWPRLLPAATLRWRVPLLVLLALHVVVAARDWGHAAWRQPAFAVAAPAMPEPADSAVLLIGGEPQAWRVPFLPPQAMYLSLGSNFPASPAYAQRVQAVLAERTARYAMLHATVDRGAERVERLNQWAQRLGWDTQPGCSSLRRLAGKRLRADLDESQPGRCVLKPRAGAALDIAAADAATRAAASVQLAALGWTLDEASCQRLPAHIGGDDHPYQWCRLLPAG
ncbi:MAG TPA: hypothetical protein VD865_11520 [Stenotrophomonas sp.]|nr:hypothetical protein [Stenotrophomonas sp.]